MAVPPDPPPERRFLEIRMLIRAVGIASDGKKLILAALGLLATIGGWSLLDRAFGPPTPARAAIGPGWAVAAPSSVDALADLARRMAEPARVVVGPVASLFARGLGARDWFRSATMGLWALAVWGLFGGAIARIAVVQAAIGGRVGVTSAARFALRKAGPLIGSPLTPMLAVAMLAAPCAAFGLLYRIPGHVGASIARALEIFPLLAGLVLAYILLGLAAAWPLMHATIAAEGEDAPDALSRSYSYVNQRLARYAAHVLAAWAIGTVGLVLVILFARTVIGLAGWGVGLGAPDPGPSAGPSPTFWIGAVGWLVHGWIYSYFWSAASVIYLILRRDVDGTDWHDVHLPEHAADTFAEEPDRDAPVEKSEVAEAGLN